MTVQEMGKKLLRAATKKTPRTTADLAARAGLPSGRAASGGIGYLLSQGSIRQTTGSWNRKNDPPAYVRTA